MSLNAASGRGDQADKLGFFFSEKHTSFLIVFNMFKNLLYYCMVCTAVYHLLVFFLFICLCKALCNLFLKSAI